MDLCFLGFGLVTGCCLGIEYWECGFCGGGRVGFVLVVMILGVCVWCVFASSWLGLLTSCGLVWCRLRRDWILRLGFPGLRLDLCFLGLVWAGLSFRVGVSAFAGRELRLWVVGIVYLIPASWVCGFRVGLV